MKRVKLLLMGLCAVTVVSGTVAFKVAKHWRGSLYCATGGAEIGSAVTYSVNTSTGSNKFCITRAGGLTTTTTSQVFQVVEEE
jgi:hypothetical protein